MVGWAMKRAKTITIEREDRKSQLQTFRQAVQALEAGRRSSKWLVSEGKQWKERWSSIVFQ